MEVFKVDPVYRLHCVHEGPQQIKEELKPVMVKGNNSTKSQIQVPQVAAQSKDMGSELESNDEELSTDRTLDTC